MLTQHNQKMPIIHQTHLQKEVWSGYETLLLVSRVSRVAHFLQYQEKHHLLNYMPAYMPATVSRLAPLAEIISN